MNKDRLEILKREIVASNINDLAKGTLLLSIECGELSDYVFEELYDRLLESWKYLKLLKLKRLMLITIS